MCHGLLVACPNRHSTGKTVLVFGSLDDWLVVYAQRVNQIDRVQVVDGNAGTGVEVDNLLLAIFGVLTGCVISLFPSQ